MTIGEYYKNNTSLFSLQSKALFTWLPDITDILDKCIKDNFSRRELYLLDSTAIQEEVYIELFINKYRYGKLYNTTVLDYSPLENYDRTETSSTEKTNTITHGDQSETVNTSTGEQINTTDGKNKISPFDTPNLVDTDGSNITDTEGARNDSSTLSRNSYNDTDNGVETITSRIHGNIGVTTSQQMLMSERDVANFSLIKIIANDVTDSISYNLYF